MSFKPICDDGQYQVSADGNLSLPVEVPNLPTTVVVNGVTLQKRSEFHVTLLHPQSFFKKYPSLPLSLSEELKEMLCVYVKECPILFAGFRDEFLLATRGEQ